MNDFLIEAAKKQTLMETRDNREDLLKRSAFLKGHDKTLVNMYIKDGYTLSQLSSLAGVSESTISRRLKKICKRLMNPKVSTFIENRHRFQVQERKIISDYLREGMSQRQISKKRNTTRYKVRQAIYKLEAFNF